MQKSLHGLDNVTAEGAEAFDKMSSILDSIAELGMNTNVVQKLLKASKRYLKTDYKVHIGRNEQCCDHCSAHALSDAATPELKAECKHEHKHECERCEV